MTATPAADEHLRISEFTFPLDASSVPALCDNDIHLWHGQLKCDPEVVTAYRGVLSSDELERAGRFHFPSNRDEFVASRGSLRTLLGHYLKRAPSELAFRYSQFGRPELAVSNDVESIQFNVSHSGTALLLGFARNRRIGVDVERIRTDFGTTEIAERFFSLAERVALRELPVEQRHAAFFRCWTRKEAFIKALGEGLSHPLDQFDVSLAPGIPAALLATRPDPDDAKRWSVWDVTAPDGYAGALAVEIA